MRFVAVLVLVVVAVTRCPAQDVAQSQYVASVVDHRARQSSVRDQGDRPTCLAHAVVASLEAQGGLPTDLSEEYLHHQFVELNRQADPEFDRARGGVHVATLVNGYRGFAVCEERFWPYESDSVDPAVTVPAEAVADAVVRFSAVERLRRPSIEALEGLLAAGQDVVLEVPGDWGTEASVRSGGLMDLPAEVAKGGKTVLDEHFLLAVGYDRVRGVIIAKNSFGEGWGDRGYAYLTYRFVRERCSNALVITGEAGAATAAGAASAAPVLLLLGTVAP